MDKIICVIVFKASSRAAGVCDAYHGSWMEGDDGGDDGEGCIYKNSFCLCSFANVMVTALSPLRKL